MPDANAQPAGNQPGTPSADELAAQAAAAAAKPADTPDLIGQAGNQGDGNSTDLGKAKPSDGEANKDGAVVEVQYEPTGDPGLDLTLSFLGKLGFDLDRPSMQKAGEGDFSLLRAELALLGDKARGWEQVIAVGEAAHNKKAEEFKAKAEADKKAIAEAAGGVEQWNKVKEWAGKNAEPAERDQINHALKQGGLVGQAMAAFLATQFSNATGITERKGSGIKEDAGSGAGTTPYALSPTQYSEGINKLKKEYGSRFTETTEYQELQARRRSWRG